MGKETTRKHLTLYEEQVEWAEDNYKNLSAFVRAAIEEKRERGND